MRGLTGVLAAVAALSAVVAACGPVATNEMHPILEVLEAKKSADVAPSAVAPIEPPVQERPLNEKNTSVLPSRMRRDISQIGLDPDHLVPMQKLTIEQKKALMPLFVKALGYAKPGDPGCNGCHTPGNFKAETRNRTLAREMYDRWSVGLGVIGSSEANPTGDTVFCDSCHANKAKVLDRTNEPALRAFMKTEYTDKLVRRQEGGTTCATCHGSDLEIAIFDKVWKVPPGPGASPLTTPVAPH